MLANVISRQQIQTYRDSVFEFLSRRRVMILLTVFPAIFLFTTITLLPMLWAYASGFFEISIYSPEWTWVGLDNYVEILQDSAFWGSVWRGTLFTVGSTGVQLVFGVAIALLVNRDFAFKYVVRTIVFLPYLIPTAVVGFIGLWVNNSTFGITNQILVQLGIIENFIPWYGNAKTAMASVIMTHSWRYTLFVTIMVLARLQSIPDQLYEAAEMAGANAYQQFRDVTLPNIKSVIFIVVLLRGVWNFNKFDIVWVLTRGGPFNVTKTAPVYAYEVAFEQQTLGRAGAVSGLLFFILIGVAIIYFVKLRPEEEVRVE